MAFFVIDRVETGNRIIARRKALYLSRDGLADCLSDEGIEVSITSIGKWERGECEISESHARALCHIFGCKLCELVVAHLSFYDDERDQLAPLGVHTVHKGHLQNVGALFCSMVSINVSDQPSPVSW